MIKDKLVIWGTGKFAKQFMIRLASLNQVYYDIFDVDLFKSIEYFVDKDKSKHGTYFCEKIVKGAEELTQDTIQYCVVTVRMNGKSIYDELGDRGIRAVSDIDFVQYIKREIVKHRDTIFQYYKLDFLLKGREDFTGLICRVKRALAIVEDKNDYALNYIIFSLMIEKWKMLSCQYEYFDIVINSFQLEFIVAAIEWIYGYEISKLYRWFSKNIKSVHRENKGKETIGIVVQRYYGGGIEKVISLLIPMYINNGHKVVLISDKNTFDEKVEYELPVNASRCLLEHGMEDEQEERIKELLQCIDENHIDIICIHSGYARIETFYEMLAMKIRKIPILLEIHSAIHTIMKIDSRISSCLLDMYKMADGLVVLSQDDKRYLERNGCNSTYISNPIDEELKKLQPRLKRECTETIVWVGRIVQNPKCVLDTILIMKKVVEVLPNAKLKIIGSADQKRIYNLLVKGIKEYNLQENIEICEYQANIQDVYKNADVVLMTSVSESFSNVILESKVLGIPLVMYELPWLELVKDKRGYFAVKPRDIDAAAQKIIEIIGDKKLREKMGREARSSVEPFLVCDLYNDWKKLFEQVMMVKDE